jgi:histidine ammonia-lyase
MSVQIDGTALSWQAVAAVAAGAPLGLSGAAFARIAHARALVDVIAERRLRCYGVTTGVGALCDVLVDSSQHNALSYNILMSHACGVGDPLSIGATRAIMASAINNFAHGHSGVRVVVVERLLELLNCGLIPLVPRAGSIGYLTHMAHISLVLVGQGAVRAGTGVIDGAEALQRLAAAPLVLQAKEGLSLVNGTADSTGLACVALSRLSRLLNWADIVAAMTFENIGHQPAAFSQQALRFQRSESITSTGATLTGLLAGSALLAQAATRTQDALSLRAIPQVHGAVRDCCEATAAVVDRELGSVTDNPIVAGTLQAPEVYAGAYAVASALAQSLDSLAIATAKIAAMSERRIDRLMNPQLSGLPAFLVTTAGVSSGFMIAQYTALALAADNRRLAAPSSLDGGVSSAMQEDEISHSSAGALRALQIVDNFERILAIELLAACQAYELQPPRLARASATDAVYRSLRARIGPYADDRPLAGDIEAAVDVLQQAAPIT